MNAQPRRPDRMTSAAFLAWEQTQEDRFELVDGAPRMMAGGSHARHLIPMNIAVGLRAALRGGPCTPLQERKVLTPRGNYRYPDVTVECGQPSMNALAAETPTVVFEVESPTTSEIDALERFEDFQCVPSIRQIVIVSQTAARARVYSREGEGWRGETVTGLEASLALTALGCELAMAAVFEGVGVA